MRQDPEIKTGLVKCRDVILNTVGERVFHNNQQLLTRVIKEIKKKEQEEKNRRDKKTRRKQKDSDLMILGKMQKDVEFLEDFLNFENIGKVRCCRIQDNLRSC